ncbi:type 1 glutamine amidotransferase [Roseibium sp.]|uniref:type 1 glutamine amidotransferase n=1 Tax=Roseibium sp. TaxID=1936156 RepID=UPI003A9692F2
MRVLVLENYPGTPLGLLGQALEGAGVRVTSVPAHAGAPVPEDHVGHEGLVVLGGEQNALDDLGYPFLPQVCELIRTFHAAGKPVLGICLGSQLIARAFGGENILGRPVEFGWHEVRPTDEGRGDPVIGVLKEGAALFHWHSDTVGLPREAVHLAQSDATPVQAYRIGQSTYATQFHFEAGLKVVRQWSESFSSSILVHTPDWPERMVREARGSGVVAERAGLEVAHAWVALLSKDI